MNPTLRRMIALAAAVSLAEAVAQDGRRTASPQPRGGGAPEGAVAHRDVAYVPGGHERQVLDLFVPSSGQGPFPLIIWIHGGGWQNGSKDGCPPLRNGYIQRGYAVASLNYRLSGHAVFPAQIEDCKAAVRWLRAHAAKYNLDPARFGAWGSSAGGHLVALLGTSGDVKAFNVGEHPDQSSRVQAVCDYYGPTDFELFVSTPGYESHATDTSPEAKLLGGAVKTKPDAARRASPVAYVTPDDPPFLIVHGDRDLVVPINQSQRLFEALTKAGVSVHFHTIRGAGHGQGFGGPEIDPMVAAFFERHLKSSAPPARGDSKASESEASGPPGGERRPEPSGDRPPEPRGDGRVVTFDALLQRLDRDGDGRISRDEFRGPPPLFDRLDTDRDGFVIREEHESAFRNRPETPPARGEPPGRPPASAPPPAAANERPTTVSPTGFTLDGERWTYRDGGLSMNGILVKPDGEGPFPAVLVSHGLGGSANSFSLQKARELARRGFLCIAPDYTHSAQAAGGRSGTGGGPTGGRGGAHPPDFGASAENIRRARACVDLLRTMPAVDARRVFAYGHSMGAFVTIGLAASDPGLLAAAAITAGGVAPRDGFPAPSEDAAERIRSPFLIFHGSADTVVRPEQSESLKAILDRNRVPNERIVFPGEGHGIDRARQPEIFDGILAWFSRIE